MFSEKVQGGGSLKKPPCICKTKKYISSPQDQVHRDLMNQAQEQGMLPGTLSGALLAAESGEVDIEYKKVIATRVPLTWRKSMAIPADYVKSQAFIFIVLPTCNPETEMLRVKMPLNIADTCSIIIEEGVKPWFSLNQCTQVLQRELKGR